MPDEVFKAGVERIREYCAETGQSHVTITFHGGEPCLAGPERISRWSGEARDRLAGVASIRLVIQTNGTQLTRRFAEVFSAHDIDVGISMDGPEEIHDRERVDHGGKGSYNAVRAGMEVLRSHDIPFAILCVVNFDADPVGIHQHFESLGPTGISYLMPDHTYDTVEPIRAEYGRTPCADYLIPIFEEWWHNGTIHTRVQPFISIARMILGGESELDCFGTRPLGFLFIEADGTIEGLDVLRICGNGFAQTELNVLRDTYADLSRRGTLHSELIFEGRKPPAECSGCPEESSCAGGYYPHRYSRDNGFSNRTVWCEDILALFEHLRNRLDVKPEETQLRRQVLAELEVAQTVGKAPA